MLALVRTTKRTQPSKWRRYTSKSVPQTSRIPAHKIYVSKSIDPYFNLSLEDWLFKFKPPKDPLLLLYRNSPCVIIGRNQNPWKEINLPALRDACIPFVRRRSGGGTVFHDIGNTNFSIHLPRTAFNRHATAQVVLRALRSLDIDAHVNDRNDMCVGPYKVSGSAYKIVNNRAYHHGTMLIAAELGTLGDMLHVNKDAMITRGVASVRSPVRNLCWFQPEITHEDFANAIIRAFREEYGVNDSVHEVSETEDLLGIPYIRDSMSELSTWAWAFGQTPEFTYTMKRTFPWGDTTVKLKSKHGLIRECTFEVEDVELYKNLETLGSSLVGRRYGSIDVRVVEEGPVAEVSTWLSQEMTR